MRAGNDNERQFEGPISTSVDLSYCDGEVRVLKSMCTMGSPSVIAGKQNESHGCRPWFFWSDTNVMVKKCWIGLLQEMRRGCITSPPALKRSRWFEKNLKNRRQKNSKLFCGQTKWCAQFLGMWRRVIWQEYLLKCTTINVERYCETLLRKAIKRKRLGLLMEGVILLHDNARPRSANITRALLQQFQWDVFRHPPYSPNLTPSNFALFPALQVALDGKKFSNDEVKTFTRNYFANLGTQFYQSNIQKLVSRYVKCSNLFGD